MAFVGIFLLELPFPLIVIAAGLVGYWVARTTPALLGIKPPEGAPPPKRPDRWREAGTATVVWSVVWWTPVVLAVLVLGPRHVLVSLGVFFSKLAVVSFGGAYALMAYMAQEVVDAQGWLKLPEMVDGLGLAETTPGPLILVTQFVGFLAAYREAAPFSPLVAAVLGAAMTTWTVFAPSFLWIFAGAPFVEDLRHNRNLAGALAAITAAVVGVILNLAAWFTLHVLFHQIDERHFGPLRYFAIDPASLDVMAAVLTAIAAALVFWLHRGLIETIAIMAALGIAVRLAGL
jgi:chromate transporter